MANGIIFVIGVIIIVVAAIMGGHKGYKSYDGYTGKSNASYRNNIIAVIIGLVVIVLSQCFVVIPTGYTGVKSTFGQISEKTLPNGFNIKIPFIQSVDQINNKQQDIIFKDSKISSETSERNTVIFSGITVTYKINPDKSAWIARNVTDWDENLVNESLIASAIKTSSKTLSPVDVTNRSKLEPIAQENIQDSLDQKYGKGVITINKVVISEASFDKEYDDKIAKKQQAQMDYEKQQIENKKNVEKAEADAKVKKTNAEAEAEATKIAAQAEAEANKKLANSITDKLINNKLAEARLKHGWVTVNGNSTVVTDNRDSE